MTRFPKCEECGNRFDSKDKRAEQHEHTARCPLCALYWRGTIYQRWCYGNSCQGLFPYQTYDTEADAKEAAIEAHEGDFPDTRVVPVVVAEIPRDYRDDPSAIGYWEKHQ